LRSLPAQATDFNAALVAPASSFAAAFNAGTAAFPAGVFTEDCTVQDEFSPYSWDGRGSIRTWYTATLGGTPRRAARLSLLPASMSFSVHRKRFGFAATTRTSSFLQRWPTMITDSTICNILSGHWERPRARRAGEFARI
jgi:hypothetical protein